MQIHQSTIQVNQPTALFAAAQEMEVMFIANFLSHMETEGEKGLTGGAGQDEFQSLLHQEQARAIVAQGGFGFTQAILNSLGHNADVP